MPIATHAPVISLFFAFAVNLDASAAQIIPVSQMRMVQGDANTFNRPATMQDIDQITALDFGPFIETLITTATVPSALATAESFQQSTISPCTLSALGTMHTTAEAFAVPAQSYVIGHSQFRMTFDVNVTSPFAFTGFAEADAFSRVTVILTGPNNTTIVHQQIDDASVAVEHQGTLAAGRYTIDVTAFAGAATQGSVTSLSTASQFNVIFTLCTQTGDVNHDGIVNIDDLVQLLTSWGPCPAAPGLCESDVNNSGAVNIDDLVALITSWST